MAETEVKIKVKADTSQAAQSFETLSKKVENLGRNSKELDQALKNMKHSTSWVAQATEMWDKYERVTEKALRTATKMADGIAKGVNALDSLKGALEGLPGPFGQAAQFGAALGGVLDKTTNAFGSQTIAARALRTELLSVLDLFDRISTNRGIDMANLGLDLLQGQTAIGSYSGLDFGNLFDQANNSEAAKKQRQEAQEERDYAAYLADEEKRHQRSDAARNAAKARRDAMRGFDQSAMANERARLGASIGYSADEDDASTSATFRPHGANARVDVGAYRKQGTANRNAERIEEDLKKQTELAFRSNAAFGALSAGLAASVEAAITGSQSIGQAFRNAAAAALKATAVESTVKAAYHTAAGVGALALGPIGGLSAAGHFKAAALYAGTAALAGVSAAGLGGGGGGGGYAGAGGSGGGGGGFSRPSSGGDNAPIVINIGHGFVGDEKKLGTEIHRAVRTAKRSGGARDSSAIGHD